jgi:DNA-binding protein H-NS
MAKTKESQLIRIQKQIQMLEAKQKALLSRKNDKALSQIVAIATKNEITADEIINALTAPKRGRKSPAKKEKRVAVPPKYKNPNNPEQTWSGRGRTPLWVQELRDAGNLESATI